MVFFFSQKALLVWQKSRRKSSLGANLGPTWANFGRLGANSDQLEANMSSKPLNWGHVGAILGVKLGILERSLSILYTSYSFPLLFALTCRILEPTWAHLGSLGLQLGLMLGPFGSYVGVCWGMLGYLEASWS